MRKLIIQTLAFFVITCGVIFLLLRWSNKQVSSKAQFVVPGNIQMIVLGHSHPECAFNDSLIANFRNFARSGESYFYTYYKIIPLLRQNKQINTVFIEFDNNRLVEKVDGLIWGSRYISYQYPNYGSFFDGEGNQLLFRKNWKSFINNQALLLKKNLEAIRTGAFDLTKNTGGFIYLERDQTDSILAARKKDPAPAAGSPFAASKNLYYLEKLIRVCRRENRKVYLVRSPLHPEFEELRNENFFQQIRGTRFGDIEFLDFKDFPLLNTDYANLEHLNFRGARKFSIFFNDLLQKGLMNKVNKQEFINSEMKRE
ncbi:MAG: hypothetical protein ABI688_02335 [Bacteroidota bacterium]